MKHTTLALPDDLTDWPKAGDRAAELHSDTVAVDRQWWADALAESALPGPLHGNMISRSDLFAIGARAAVLPEDASALLWNVVAFCLGRRNSDGKKRIAAVSARSLRRAGWRDSARRCGPPPTMSPTRRSSICGAPTAHVESERLGHKINTALGEITTALDGDRYRHSRHDPY